MSEADLPRGCDLRRQLEVRLLHRPDGLDRDQLLWELRQENTESSLTGDAQKPSSNTYTGTLSYIHAGGIDAPVGLVKNGSPVILHRNWRGLFAFSTDSRGLLPRRREN